MTPPRAARNTLSREVVIDAALNFADAHGLAKLTVRALADDLGVGAMSLYHHVSNKDALLDALVDAVHAQMQLPSAEGEWRSELAERARSMRAVLAAHPWAVQVLNTRANPGDASPAAQESVLEVLARAGFSLKARAEALAILDAFVLGFATQEAMLAEVGVDERPEELAEGMPLDAFPRIGELAAAYVDGQVRFGDAFEVGLGVVLDGIARFRNETDISH